MKCYFDYSKKTISKGKESTDTFLNIIQNRGMHVWQSDINTDKYKHVDYFIMKPGSNKIMKVDIKSRSRYGFTAEVRCNKGFSGSMFGEADYLVYSVDSTLYFINPTKLINYYNSIKWNPREDVDYLKMTRLSDPSRYTTIWGRINQGSQDEWFIIPDETFIKMCDFTLS